MATLNITPVAFALPTVVKTDRYCRAPKGGITIAGKFFKGGQFCFNAKADAPAVIEAPAVEPARTTIAGFVYTIAPLAIDASIGTVAFSMHRRDTDSTYHVHRDNHGETLCTCPDFTLRKAGTGRVCKHGMKLMDLGLIARPPVEVLPPLAARKAEPAVLATLPARRRRFEPTAEDYAYAAQMFA